MMRNGSSPVRGSPGMGGRSLPAPRLSGSEPVALVKVPL